MFLLKNDFFFSFKIAACILTTTFHMVVGLGMAYSAILIPRLEEGALGPKATKMETSWTGNSKIKKIFLLNKFRF